MSEQITTDVSRMHEMLQRQDELRGPARDGMQYVRRRLGLEPQVVRSEMTISEKEAENIEKKIESVRELLFANGTKLADNQEYLQELIQEGQIKDPLDAQESYLINPENETITVVMADTRLLGSVSPQHKLFINGEKKSEKYDFGIDVKFDNSFSLQIDYFKSGKVGELVDTTYRTPPNIPINEMTDFEHTFIQEYLSQAEEILKRRDE